MNTRPVGERTACTATTKAGHRCKVPARDGGVLCARHARETPVVPGPVFVERHHTERDGSGTLATTHADRAETGGPLTATPVGEGPAEGDRLTTVPNPSVAPPGWYPDTTVDVGQARYWDGTGWTNRSRTLTPPPSPSDRWDEHVDDNRNGKDRTNAIVVILGAACIAVGAFLPWVKVSAPLIGTITRSGMDGGGDGLIFLAMAGFIGIWALYSMNRPPRARSRGLIALVCAGAVLLDIFEYSNVSNRIADAEGASDLISGTIGSGVILIGFGAGLAFVAALRMRAESASMSAPAS